ncbi:RNA-directed DNA polymerase, eukaryota, reverse transcriptase zinc-binding domain protein [Tanacetum coccineum]
MPNGANSSFFTLIPKVNNPTLITDFRPISLIGIHYKIIAKILANRLSKVIDKIVSKEQSAFIAGRQILDGPVILSEIIEWYKKQKKKLLIFKVDFEKAFDSISWNYLIHILDSFGFGNKWQGDHLSPFFFILVMEGLHNAFEEAVGNDDVDHLRRIGMLKDKDNIIRCDIPFNYLGLPIGSNMKSIASWKTLSWVSTIYRFFSAPESVLQDLKEIRAKFFWGGNKDENKMAWVKWPIILNSFDKGGLNIGSLKAFNLALLQKWRWRLLSSPNALWVQVIKAYHGQEGGFDTNGCSFKGIWANIVGTSNFLHSKGIILSNTFRFKAGCGTRIRFWKDIWVGETPLFTRYNRLYHLDQDKDCLIIDRINNGKWSWNWSRPILVV